MGPADLGDRPRRGRLVTAGDQLRQDHGPGLTGAVIVYKTSDAALRVHDVGLFVFVSFSR